MGWTSGPFDDHAVLWLGLQVFWWRRIFSAVQIVLGSLALTAVLTEQNKLFIQQRLRQASASATQVRVPPVLKLKTFLKWFFIAAPLLSGLAALFVPLRLPNGQPIPASSVFLLAGILISIVALPIFLLALYASLFVTIFQGFRRFGPPAFAWLLSSTRLDRSIAVVSFLLFALVSAIQLFLS